MPALQVFSIEDRREPSGSLPIWALARPAQGKQTSGRFHADLQWKRLEGAGIPAELPTKELPVIFT